jgi:hypothetical protein
MLDLSESFAIAQKGLFDCHRHFDLPPDFT